MTGFNRLFVWIVIGGFGTAVALAFLFGLIDALVNEKLDARRQPDPKERSDIGESNASVND